mmetsp:Transcript_27810/g.81358  ORF Transcript_27810/g.81358 Transcript_27810/m.81358 type:complete len:226 (+) Transcript_27810:1323-2000(+)
MPGSEIFTCRMPRRQPSHCHAGPPRGKPWALEVAGDALRNRARPPPAAAAATTLGLVVARGGGKVLRPPKAAALGRQGTPRQRQARRTIRRSFSSLCLAGSTAAVVEERWRATAAAGAAAPPPAAKATRNRTASSPRGSFKLKYPSVLCLMCGGGVPIPRRGIRGYYLSSSSSQRRNNRNRNHTHHPTSPTHTLLPTYHLPFLHLPLYTYTYTTHAQHGEETPAL